VKRSQVRLIAKWLMAGVLEDGRVIETEEGTPQGAVISPLLANICLHHVYDQWVHQWRQRCATGTRAPKMRIIPARPWTAAPPAE
jgi:RNA-directed DNA polymerase